LAETETRELAAKEVQRPIEALLLSDLDDSALLEQLEELSRVRAFAGFTWLWGPELYRRSRTMFRPFILNHFRQMATMARRSRTPVVVRSFGSFYPVNGILSADVLTNRSQRV
jgi:hypothetical protein